MPLSGVFTVTLVLLVAAEWALAQRLAQLQPLRPMPGFNSTSKSNESIKYVVTFPTILQKSKDFKINMVLFPSPSYQLPVAFTANLTTEGSLLVSQTFTQTRYGLQQHVFSNVKSAIIPDDAYLTMAISFKADGLQNYTDLSASERLVAEKFVFIQTDKKLYKPAQTVNLRVVVLNRNLSAVTGQVVNVSLEDPKGNRLKMWTNQQLTKGTFTGSYSLSDFVSFGDWKITVSGKNVPLTDKTFEVRQYVLPKFEVQLDFSQSNKNGYWLFSGDDESKYYGAVRAKYTFGMPVRGSATIVLKKTGGCNFAYDSPDWYSDASTGASKNVTKLTLSATLTGDGSTDDGKFTVMGLNGVVTYTPYFLPPLISPTDNAVAVSPPSPRMNSQECQLTFQVNMTEDLTGETITSEGNVMLYRDSYKISVHDSVQKTLKPGLPFTMRFQISTPDGTPVGANLGVIQDVYFWNDNNSIQSGQVSCGNSFLFPDSRAETTSPIPSLSVQSVTDDQGIVLVKVDVPKGVTSVLFRARISNKSAGIEFCETRYPPQSNSRQSVSISVDRSDTITKKIPKVGDKLTFKIAASFPVPMVYFLVAQNGQPFIYNQLTNPAITNSISTVYMVNVTLPAEAAPRCVAIVWTVENTTGEILADAVEFKVDGLVRQNVSASFYPSAVRPREQTKLTIKTIEPNSFVALLAVDKSVRLLRSGNDISLDDVLSAVGSRETVGRYRPVMPLLWRCWRCGWWPSSIDSSNADSVFSGAGMTIKSNVITGNAYFPLWSARVAGGFGGPVLRAMPVDMAVPMMSVQKDLPANDPKVRVLFPETWLWNDTQTSLTGSLTMSLTAPDTITTWVATVFAIGDLAGFGSLDAPAELTVFQDFFVNLDISQPTIIRGEQVQIKAVVFNYQKKDASVNLLLKQSSDFSVSLDDGGSFVKADYRKTVNVKANSGSSIPIWIKPVQLGTIKLGLTGSSATSSDAIVKEVFVEPEGEVLYANSPIFIRLADKSSEMTATIDAESMLGYATDDAIVPGSKIYQLQAIGDILGPALSQLGSQIRMPTGCGEQTMIILAPNVYIYKYLKAVNLLTDDLSAKTTSFVDQGYQRELTYQRSDGGFSAFGNSDNASSTWLTAFVLRSFAAAKNYMNSQVNATAVNSGWNFVQQQARADGLYTEPGQVIHTSMKGGAGSDVNLAAYVYATAAEAGVDSKILPSLQATRQLLINTGRNSATTDPYQLAIITYALSIRTEDRPYAQNVIKQLLRIATKDGSLTYWKPNNQKVTASDQSEQVGSGQIETSAYVLLAMLSVNGMSDEAVPIGRWLMSQRNSLGGFASTQDTVVGLQALSEFASQISSNGQDFVIQASLNYEAGDPVSTLFIVNSSNAQLLQSFDPPRDRQLLKSIDISVKGVGVGLVQLSLRYNVQDQQTLDSGDYSITVTREAMARRKRRAADERGNELGTNDLDALLKTCVQPTQPNTGMVLTELQLPTGFEADLTATQNANKITGGNYKPPLKRIELGHRKVVFYLDALDNPRRQVCFYAKISRTVAVSNVQPPVARVYSYYAPTRVNATEYIFPGMSVDDTTACEDIEINVDCPDKK